MAKQPGKPKQGFNEIVQAGEKAYVLGTAHQSALEPRLPAGCLEGLRADLDSLTGKVTAQKTATMGVRSATASQAEALAAAHELISAVRQVLTKAKASTDTRRAYGLGTRLQATMVTSVLAAGRAILARAAASPDEARGFGILESDLSRLASLLDAAASADQAQEGLRASAPQQTGERNRCGRRIVAAVGRIAGAGVLAFAEDAALRQQFDALDAGPRKKPAAKKTEG
jgi:hypothetical protein